MVDNSKGRASPTVECAFELLDRWRHLPAYQLERRADIFFALYLPEVLGEHFGRKINPLLVPEFPIRKGLLHGNGDNQSIKADYLALEDGAFPKRAFLVELKTDSASQRDDQDENLGHAVDVGLKGLVEGVIDICGATDQRRKYVHLLHLLSRLGLIEYEDDLFPVKRGFSEALCRVKHKVEEKKEEEWPSLELVFVRPKNNTIGFEEFAKIISKGGPDDLRSTFAHHLRTWACTGAGEPDPKDWNSC